MHHAPAVSYPVGRSAFQGLLLAVLGAGGLAVQGGWWQSGASVRPWLAQAGAVACLALWLWAIWCWRQAPAGRLHWDGEGWRWETSVGAQAGWPRPRLDWQSGLLLEFVPDAGGRAHWLWLERRSDALRWDALRRAVHAGRRGGGA